MTTRIPVLDIAWAEWDKLWAEGNKLWAEGDKLRAEGNKLRAEGNKLWAEGDLIFIDAIIAHYGKDCVMKWTETGCTVESITYERNLSNV